MMAGVAKQRRGARRKGTSSDPGGAGATFPKGEGLESRKVFDVWYTPTIRDVYAQVLVAKTMLDRIPDQDLAVVKREMGILEDMLWQFK